jgi:hypothetical protein
MGFTPKSTVYLLQFEGEDLAGLEVRMRAAKLGVLFIGPEAFAVDERMQAGEKPTAADLEAVTFEFRSLADHLVSWNLDDDGGNPVPATLEGLKTLEVPLVARITKAWQSAMKEVPAPLSKRSSNGALPDLSSIPMASIPASLAS